MMLNKWDGKLDLFIYLNHNHSWDFRMQHVLYTNQLVINLSYKI